MFAQRDFDWVEGIIVLIVLVGSALSGLGKAIAGKLNKKATLEPDDDGRETPEPKPARREIVIPPVARPLVPTQPPRRVVIRPERQVPPRAPQQTPRVEMDDEFELEVPLPKAVRPIVEKLLERAGMTVESETKPTAPPPPPRGQQPRQPRPKAKTRPASFTGPAITEHEARLRDIEEREARQAQRVEQRIGHVETHVRPATQAEADEAHSTMSVDRKSLRRAVILNEILSPPLALREERQQGAGW